MRVLIVDDDPRFAAAVTALLESLDGVETVGVAGDGLAAELMAYELRPDVVLMDIDMPVLDGIDATRRIVQALPRTKVVILSGSDIVAHLLDARGAGAVAHVPKPDAFAQLPEVLAALGVDGE